MQADPILCVYRFSKSDYIDDFVHGRLYMNPLAHFVKIEENPVRRDECEGQAAWMQGTLSVEINGVFEPISDMIGPIAYADESNLAANVFCMYALRASVAKRPVDPRILEFGDTFAGVREGGEFLRRVGAAAKKAGQELQCHLVEYVDPSVYHGPMGIFRKSSEFLYQSELRIAILPGMRSPHRLEVGDLSDITITGPLKDWFK